MKRLPDREQQKAYDELAAYVTQRYDLAGLGSAMPDIDDLMAIADALDASVSSSQKTEDEAVGLNTVLSDMYFELENILSTVALVNLDSNDG